MSEVHPAVLERLMRDTRPSDFDDVAAPNAAKGLTCGS